MRQSRRILSLVAGRARPDLRRSMSMTTRRRSFQFTTLVGLFLCLFAAGLLGQQGQLFGLWSPLPSLPLTGGIGEANHTATLLGDGTILVAGGNSQAITPTASALTVASLYQPSQNGWFSLPNMATDRAYHGAALLQNLTSVLVAGGYSGTTAALSFNVGGACGIQNPLGGPGASTGFGTNTAELFDENMFSWTPAASMNSARAEFTLVRLLNGQILAPAGDWSGQTAEIYDPPSNTWSKTASMNGGRVGAATTLLPDGRVFVAGGNFGYNVGGIAINCPSDAEVYDPIANTWSGTGSMSKNRYHATATVVHVADGSWRVLVAGGFDGNDGNLPQLQTAELWDPSTNNFTPAASLSTPRGNHTATLLPNGQVLVAGGNVVLSNGSPLTTDFVEVYDPVADSWLTARSMNAARSGHTATLELGPGPTKVVVAGGYDAVGDGSAPTFLSSAELFQPTPIASQTSLFAGQTLPGTNNLSSCQQSGLESFVQSTTGSGTPTGFVTLFDNGGNPISAPLPLTNGEAIYNTPLTLGTHTITAFYAGDGAFSSSSSSLLTQQVVAPPIQVSGPGTAFFGDPVTLFASVPAGATSPYNFTWTAPNGTGVAICSIVTAGCIAGVPPSLGPNVFTVTGTDSTGCHLGTGTFTVNVVSGHFSVSAPTSVNSGTPFNFTVTALDNNNNILRSYNGTVHFTSTDPQATLPPNYTFAPADAGVHSFSATLVTGGNQTITATDTASASITGTSGPIFVIAPDFSISAPSPINVKVGGSENDIVTVTSLNGFNSPVTLTTSGAPSGVTTSFSSNPVSPASGGAATSTLTITIGPSVTPTTFSLTITGTSGSLTHSTVVSVIVSAALGPVAAVISKMRAASCIDNSGISGALTSKLNAAQASISAGDVQSAINALGALKNQIQAQAGKHISTTCSSGGVAFNSVSTLLIDVQSLIDSLKVGLIPDPITGYVVDGNGAGVAGAVVSVLDAGGNVVATATTDITGFYFFAAMSVLTPGSSYSVSVTGLPAGFTTSTPAMSSAFLWSGTGMTIGNFVLN
jgi:N-acetylneuraminic acid mutarotase